jgi:hypothetical protein
MRPYTKTRKLLPLLALAGLMLPLGLCEPAFAQSPSTISIRLHEPLSSATSQAGDRFTGTLAEPLVIGGRIVAARDAVVIGQVGEVISSFGRYSRSAVITLRLTSIQSRTGRYPLATGDLIVKVDSHGSSNVLIIGGSAGTGAVIGGAAAAGKGEAADDAEAERPDALLNAKHEIALPADTVLTFYVTTLTLRPKELARLQPSELVIFSAAIFN